MAPVDLLTFGRVGVDLYPEQVGVGLEDVATFSKSLGGSAANVAVAGARQGLNASVVTAVGDDPFGRYLRRELTRLGVNADHVHTVGGLLTPVVFCEMFPPDDFPLYFYREPIAPELTLSPKDMDLAAIVEARVFWTTMTGLSAEPSRSAHSEALLARAGAPLTVLDLDYRQMFWPSEETAAAVVDEALDQVTVVVGNTQECAVALGTDDPHTAADLLLERGVELAVIKRGGDGVLAATPDERVEQQAYRVDVVNGLGAGDAFGGTLCRGLVDGLPLADTVRRANAAGAIVASRRECSTAMPTVAEIDALIAGELAS